MEYLTYRESAKRLGKTTETLTNAIAIGLFPPPLVINNRWCYPINEIEDFSKAIQEQLSEDEFKELTQKIIANRFIK